MNVPVKVAAFFAALAVVFGIALAIGSQVDPFTEPARAHDAEHGSAHDDESGVPNQDLPGGLMTSDHGYTLSLETDRAAAGPAQSINFVIDGPDGEPVTDYDVEHEKQLHLIVVRRDFAGFQHVHPELATDGTWTTTADLTPGQWRVFADFKPTGAASLTLGADLAVPGDVAPADMRDQNRTSQVDGYTLHLEGNLVAGEHSTLSISVQKDGQPVTDLEPYLGAYGHLVALREGDLAYLHVHPGGEPGDGQTTSGPEVEFGAEVPSASDYHLYFDFKHDGVVRTAHFAVTAVTASDVETGSHEHADD